MQNKSLKHLENKTILIVEDDYICFQLFKEILSEMGVIILHANSSGKAIELLNENKNIALIFMDIQLPDMSGLQASVVIKNLYPQIPIIIQTAYPLESYIQKSKEIGCNEYLIKPLEPEKIIDTILKYI